MFSKQNNMLTIKKERNLAYQIFIFTALFLITAVGVYLAFIVCDRSFLHDKNNIDGIAQQYPIFMKIKHIIEGILSGQGFDFWSWDLGLGTDQFTVFESRLLNPLSYIVLLFPEKYLEIAFNIMVVMSQYLSGVSFLIFARGVGISEDRQILGALCYTFSGWVILSTILQVSFSVASIMFPLVIWGAEKILTRKSPTLFILSVAISLILSFYFSYMIAIGVILFFFARYFYYYKNQGIKQLIIFFMQFMGYGAVGIMIAGVAVIQNYLKLSGSNAGMTVEHILRFSVEDYLTIPAGFFDYKKTLNVYSHMYLPVICIAAVPFLLVNMKKSAPALLGIILFVAELFPITGSVFNGFSYTAGRWYFIVVFFIVWAVMELPEQKHGKFVKGKKFYVISALWLLLLAVWNVGICYFMLDLISDNLMLCTVIGVGFGWMIMGVCYIRDYIVSAETLLFGKSLRRMMSIGVVILLIGSIIGMMNMKFYPGVNDYLYEVARNNCVKERFDSSSQRVVPQLQCDDQEFFRTDQVDSGYYKRRIARVPTNENIYFGNRSIYTYFSTMDGRWHIFNKTVGNNAGYFDRAATYSNDNRAGLDFLMGVKYFLGDSETEKPGSSDYAAYGFEYDRTIDGVDILKSKYNMGLGTAYTSYITESELERYSPLEREQIMLQAAVVPDDCSIGDTGVHHAAAEELETKIRKVPYKIMNENNLQIEDNEITVKNGGGTFDLQLSEFENCQIIVAFQGLEREKCTLDRTRELQGEQASDDNLTRIERIKNSIKEDSFEDDQKFDIKVRWGDVVKAARDRTGKNQGFNDIENYNINAGYFEELKEPINIEINQYGDYSFDELTVYAIPMDVYDKYASILEKNRVKVTSFENDQIHGIVNADADSILYFSILNDPGWKLYVDGKKVEKLKHVNIAFTGAEISQGHHAVELRYESPGLKQGIILMCAGVLLLIGIVIVRKSAKMKRNSCANMKKTIDK